MTTPSGLYEAPAPGYVFGVPLTGIRGEFALPSAIGLPTVAGANTWTAIQTHDLGTGAKPTGSFNATAHWILYPVDTGASRMSFTAIDNVNGNNFACYAFAGTRLAPAVTPNGSAFFQFVTRGYGGTPETYPSGASFTAITDGDWSGANQGTYWEFKGTSNGSTTITTWLELRTLGQYRQLSGTAPTANTFPGNILMGVNNAAADTVGQIGETISSTVAAAAVAASAAVGDITSITLTAGKWSLCGFASILGGATGLTAGSTKKLSIVSASATNGTNGSNASYDSVHTLIVNGLHAMTVPEVIANIIATTTYYLTEEVTYAAGSPTVAASLVATRIR